MHTQLPFADPDTGQQYQLLRFKAIGFFTYYYRLYFLALLFFLASISSGLLYAQQTEAGSSLDPSVNYFKNL